MTSHSKITTLRAWKHWVKVASSTASVGGRMRSDTAPSGLLGLGHLQSSRDAVFRSTYRPASRRSSAQFWRKSSLEVRPTNHCWHESQAAELLVSDCTQV